jgi:hypothetical protein
MHGLILERIAGAVCADHGKNRRRFHNGTHSPAGFQSKINNQQFLEVPTSRQPREKWGTRSKEVSYLNDLTAEVSSSFTSNTVYSFVI